MRWLAGKASVVRVHSHREENGKRPRLHDAECIVSVPTLRPSKKPEEIRGDDRRAERARQSDREDE